jgi:hypothetical protein
LIAEQQANHGFYVLVRGQARVVKNGTLLRVVDPGHCLGETAFLSRNKVKSAITVSAVTDITVAKVDPSNQLVKGVGQVCSALQRRVPGGHRGPPDRLRYTPVRAAGGAQHYLVLARCQPAPRITA